MKFRNKGGVAVEVSIDKKTGRKLVITGICIFVIYLLLKETERVKAAFGFVYGLISPFVIGACIAFILNVPMRFFERRMRFVKNERVQRVLAICATILFVVILVAVVVWILVPQIKVTVWQIGQQLPSFFDNLNEQLIDLFNKYPPLRDFAGLGDISDGIDWMQLVENVLERFETSISNLVDSAFSLVGSVISGIYNGIFSLIFACYCLAQKETLARQGRKLLYAVVRENAADELIRILRMSNSVFSNFITGQCLDAVILGLMCAVAMAILRMPYIPLISVIIVVTALVPVVGALVGGALGALLIFVSSPIKAVIFVIMFIVVQQIDNNICYPRVVGQSIGLPGMWVLVAVLIGEKLMGVVGMLLMVPFASVLYTLLREFAAKRVAKRNIAQEKLQCQPPDLQKHFIFRRADELKQRRQETKREKAQAKTSQTDETE